MQTSTRRYLPTPDQYREDLEIAGRLARAWVRGFERELALHLLQKGITPEKGNTPKESKGMGRPSKLETMLERTDVGALVMGAKAQLAKAVQAVRLSESKSGPLYGAVVRHTGTCIDIGLKTGDISQVISTAWGNGEASKGIGARYIILARYQRRIFRKNEKPYPVKGVKVGGILYADPLKALDSGKVTFTAVYKAWTAACQVKAESQTPPESGYDSALKVFQNLTVPITTRNEEGEEVTKRVKVTEDLDAFVGALSALLQSPLAGQVTTVKQRRMILDTLTGIPKLSDHVKTSLLHVLPQAA